ncbi:MAG TPA: hypothetical protein VMB70_17130 [Terriglobia bacterium]|nr:hypothetical protein [Terriglobia bacterium]
MTQFIADPAISMPHSALKRQRLINGTENQESTHGTMRVVDTSKPKVPNREIDRDLVEHPYGWQDENGVDLSLITMNLKLTPDERVRRAQAAARQLARMLHGRVS